MSQIEITKRVLQQSVIDIVDGELFELELKDDAGQVQLALTIADFGDGEPVFAVSSTTNRIVLVNPDGTITPPTVVVPPVEGGDGDTGGGDTGGGDTGGGDTGGGDTGGGTTIPWTPIGPSNPVTPVEPPPTIMTSTFANSMVTFTPPISVRSISADIVRQDDEGLPVIIDTVDIVLPEAGTLEALLASLDDDLFLRDIASPVFALSAETVLSGIKVTTNNQDTSVVTKYFDVDGAEQLWVAPTPSVDYVYDDWSLVVKATADETVLEGEDLFDILTELGADNLTILTGAAKANVAEVVVPDPEEPEVPVEPVEPPVEPEPETTP